MSSFDDLKNASNLSQFQQVAGSLRHITIETVEVPATANALRLSVSAHYNPAELTIERGAQWQPSDNRGGEKAQQLEFVQQTERGLTFELFFDDSENYFNGSHLSTIPVHVETLEQMVSVRDATRAEDEFRRPPQVMIVWGQLFRQPLVGIIEKVSVKYQMFSPQGVPLRATATITFKEARNLGLKKETSQDVPPSQGGSTTPGSRR